MTEHSRRRMGSNSSKDPLLPEPPPFFFLITWGLSAEDVILVSFRASEAEPETRESHRVGRSPPNWAAYENTKPMIRYGTPNQETSVGPGNVGERRRKNCNEIQTGLPTQGKKTHPFQSHILPFPSSSPPPNPTIPSAWVFLVSVPV